MPEMTAGSATREINKLAKLCEESNHIQPEMYDTYHVKKGLREPSGKGVLTGLTDISTINAYKKDGQTCIFQK